MVAARAQEKAVLTCSHRAWSVRESPSELTSVRQSSTSATGLSFSSSLELSLLLGESTLGILRILFPELLSGGPLLVDLPKFHIVLLCCRHSLLQSLEEGSPASASILESRHRMGILSPLHLIVAGFCILGIPRRPGALPIVPTGVGIPRRSGVSTSTTPSSFPAHPAEFSAFLPRVVRPQTKQRVGQVSPLAWPAECDVGGTLPPLVSMPAW